MKPSCSPGGNPCTVLAPAGTQNPASRMGQAGTCSAHRGGERCLYRRGSCASQCTAPSTSLSRAGQVSGPQQVPQAGHCKVGTSAACCHGREGLLALPLNSSSPGTVLGTLTAPGSACSAPCALLVPRQPEKALSLCFAGQWGLCWLDSPAGHLGTSPKNGEGPGDEKPLNTPLALVPVRDS